MADGKPDPSPSAPASPQLPSPLPGKLDPDASTSLDLVIRCQRGDLDAVELLINRLWSALWPRAHDVNPDAGDPSGARELLCAVLRKVAVRIHQLRDPEKIEAWASAILYREAQSRRRHHQGRREVPVGTPEEVEGVSPIDEMPTNSHADLQSDAEELLAALLKSLTTLCDRCRVIGQWMLTYLKEREAIPSVETIARGAGTSHGTAQRCREQVLALWRPVAAVLGRRL